MEADIDRPQRGALHRLWDQAAGHRGAVVWASTCSVLNKLFDLAPPFLIGLAVDVVANGSSSFLADFGAETGRAQLVVLAIAHVRRLGARSALRVPVQRRVAEPGPGPPARAAHRDLRPPPGAGARAGSRTRAPVTCSPSSTTTSTSSNASSTSAPTTSSRPPPRSSRSAPSFFLIAPQVAWWAFLPMPVIVGDRSGSRSGSNPATPRSRNRAGDLNAQLANNLLASPRSRASPPRTASRPGSAEESDRYRTPRTQRDQAVLGVQPAHPHGDPRRLHGHARLRRIPRAGGDA